MQSYEYGIIECAYFVTLKYFEFYYLGNSVEINKSVLAAMNFKDIQPSSVLHWNYRGLTEFPIHQLRGEESDVTDIYIKENLISKLPNDIGLLVHLESLYISGNDITELPKEISNLKCLKCLDVSGNRLKRIPNEIGEVTNLKFLILDENEIMELPLRIAELKYLRYLSVCDNKLIWLPQKPVYNYHHCELRFWRNSNLKSLPFSLWYHMFRNQQTRSLNIACLHIKSVEENQINGQKCRLKLNQDSKEFYYDIDCPPQYINISDPNTNEPTSLFELSKRTIYEVLEKSAKKMSSDTQSIYSDRTYNSYLEQNNNYTDLNNIFNEINLNSKNQEKKHKKYYVPADLVNEKLNYLPQFIKEDLINGPVSKCENVHCKKPIFDYVYYEFTYGQVILIDNVQEVILSAALCSKTCAEIWRGSIKTIPWSLYKG